MSFSMQKQASRNLVLSPNQQTAYGGILADAALTIRQRFDTSTVFTAKPSNRTDKMMAGKGSEWATDDQITAWDTDGTLKSNADVQLLGWALAMTFGQETVTGTGPYTHTFTLPPITATMPCTTVYVEETLDVHRKFQDMAAKSLSLDVPERGACSCSLDMVGTGRWTPGSMTTLPALALAKYLLGSDLLTTITPTVGNAVAFNGRQKGTSIKIDRGSSPFQSAGDGLYSGSVNAGDGKFSVDETLAAQATDDVNGWFESGQRLSVTIATLAALPYRFGFTFPSVRIKANQVSNTDNLVTWKLSWDESTAVGLGNQQALSAFIINDTAAYLIPA